MICQLHIWYRMSTYCSKYVRDNILYQICKGQYTVPDMLGTTYCTRYVRDNILYQIWKGQHTVPDM